MIQPGPKDSGPAERMSLAFALGLLAVVVVAAVLIGLLIKAAF